jgi:hypothetical protein
VAQGRSLASAIMYSALGTAEPPLSRQRCKVRVRRGSPEGPVVGIEKIAVGNGNYTGDASWGIFCAVYAPGEVPLQPGETYAIEFETIENWETLHGFTNIKGVVSKAIPGFNPYRKAAPDTYEKGLAYKDGSAKPEDFDLDMQIVEYQQEVKNWASAVDPRNLLKNGEMEAGELGAEKAQAAAEKPDPGRPEAWSEFSIDPATICQYMTEGKDGGNRVLRVMGGGPNGATVDGGYVQRVEGLSHFETYRVSGKLRCTWPVQIDRACYIGYDPTGQTDNPKADTIVWTTLPSLHGHWVPYRSDPIRPVKDAISVWLRGKAEVRTDYPFRADFDDFAVNCVRTDVPDGR